MIFIFVDCKILVFKIRVYSVLWSFDLQVSSGSQFELSSLIVKSTTISNIGYFELTTSNIFIISTNYAITSNIFTQALKIIEWYVLL